MVIVKRSRLLILAAATCWIGWAATADADWAACQRQPTRACLLEEALRGDGAPLAGKDRLDVLILAGAIVHPEYATAADIDEAVRQAKDPSGYNYANLAIQGLVAGNRTQQAADLVASFPPRSVELHLAFTQLVRALAKAGDLDTATALLDRMAPTFEPTTRDMLAHSSLVQSVRMLAEIGRTEDAILVMTTQKNLTGLDVPEMWLSVAQAYISRGEAWRAQRVLDLAGRMLEENRRYAMGSAEEYNRWSLMSLSALRGDPEAVKTALRGLGPQPADSLSARYRTEGHQRLVISLLKARQFELALEVAKAAPDTVRDQELWLVNYENTQNGRIDDARAVMTLFSEKMHSSLRAGAVRNVAVAMVKAGKLAAAVEMAAQESNLTNRKGILFAMAQALPQ